MLKPKNILNIPLQIAGLVRRDIALLLNRKKYLYLALALPIILSLIYISSMNPRFAGKTIAVCDYDQTQESEHVLTALTDIEGFRINRLDTPDCKQELISKIKSGDCVFGLAIEKGFRENIRNFKRTYIYIYHDNTNIAFSNFLGWKIDAALMNYKTNILDAANTEIKASAKSMKDDLDIAVAFVDIVDSKVDNTHLLPLKRRLKDIDSSLTTISKVDTDFLANPIITTKKGIYDIKKPENVAITYLFPIIAFFIILMLAGTSIIYDKKTNFITRIKASTTPLWAYIVSKLLFFFIITLSQFAILFALFAARGAAFNISLPGLFIALLFISFTNTIIGMLIGLLSDNEGIAVLFALILALPLMFLSGIFFPVEFMPGFVQALAWVLPLNTHIIIMKEVLLFGTAMPTGIFYSTAIGFAVVYALLTKK